MSTLIEYLYPKLQWKVEFSVMVIANLHNLHIHDNNYKLKKNMFIVFCEHENMGLDTKGTLIEYLYPKLQWKVEFSVMAVANLNIHDHKYKLEMW